MSFESSLVWVEKGRLCFGEQPGRWRNILQDLDFLRDIGVRAILSLREHEKSLRVYLENGFLAAHLPLFDFQAPSQQQMDNCMQMIEHMVRPGRALYVHCFAGLGRSGTVAAAWLIKQGRAPVEAIDTIRRLRPGAVENDAQYNSLLEFASRLRG